MVLQKILLVAMTPPFITVTTALIFLRNCIAELTHTSGAAHGMLIWVLLVAFVAINVVANPVDAPCWIHLAVPKSAICDTIPESTTSSRGGKYTSLSRWRKDGKGSRHRWRLKIKAHAHSTLFQLRISTRNKSWPRGISYTHVPSTFHYLLFEVVKREVCSFCLYRERYTRTNYYIIFPSDVTKLMSCCMIINEAHLAASSTDKKNRA